MCLLWVKETKPDGPRVFLSQTQSWVLPQWRPLDMLPGRTHCRATQPVSSAEKKCLLQKVRLLADPACRTDEHHLDNLQSG